MLLKNSNRGEFSYPRALYIWQSEQVGIIAMKIERAWIHDNYYLNDICLPLNSANFDWQIQNSGLYHSTLTTTNSCPVVLILIS